MSFALIHVDDAPGGPGEEAYVIVPNGEKVAFAVPIDAVGLLAPAITELVADRPPPCCRACGAELPSRAQEP